MYITTSEDEALVTILLSLHVGNCKAITQTFQLKININCQTSNCIYLITCSHCGIQYVGQTKNKLLTRFNSHHYDIVHNSDTTVPRHFNRCPRDNPAKFDGLTI